MGEKELRIAKVDRWSTISVSSNERAFVLIFIWSYNNVVFGADVVQD